MNEDAIEQSMLEVLADLGWAVAHGPKIGPDGLAWREFHEVVLRQDLEDALIKLNPQIPQLVLSEVYRRLVNNSGGNLIDNNYHFHKLLIEGVPIEYRDYLGNLKSDIAWAIDFKDYKNNTFRAINQLTIIQDGHNRRPDVVLYVNGLPLGLVELKNAIDSKADLPAAYQQIQTYKREISDLFRFNAVCVISDGIDAEIGVMTSPLERMLPWKTINGQRIFNNVPMLEVLTKGVFNKQVFLDLIQNYIVFERDGKKGLVKKLAAYHQYWVVQKALVSTIKASAQTGDQRAGVVWHTQGSGKSLSMVFYAGKMMRSRELNNPTIVVVTDRNDLDDQLFDTFSACQELLGEEPKKADSRRQLRELLNGRQAGGIIFTTIQKFSTEENEDKIPLLSDRRNIIVMADEAHRSQYGLEAKVRQIDSQLVYGYAKHMRDALPEASYIGFTGTPIELSDRSTPAVFGDYVDIYDIKQAVEDGATVPIYYESRLIDLGLDETTKQWLDQETERLLEGEDEARQSRLKTEYAQKSAIVGNEERLNTIALDIIEHFEGRQSALDGKGMIVTMSRQIAADLYEKIIAYRPEWGSDDDNEGVVKVVITGSAGDPDYLQKHIRNKQRVKIIERRIKNPQDKLELVIVCDMWLTGFDVPNMHTMYLDKPLKGHNLMQAIARVNRTFPGKTGGLVVDYLGVAGALRDAMIEYTRSGGQGATSLDIKEAIAKMMTCYEVVRDMFGNFNYKSYFHADDVTHKMQILLDAQEYILSLQDGEKRYNQAVLELSKAFALVMPRDEALVIREQVAFFQAVNARLKKLTAKDGASDEEYKLALKQLVDKAIAPQGVIDVFAAAGLDRPEISILSEDFFAEIRQMKRRNLAVEALKRLLNDEIKARYGKNAIKDTKFSEMLDGALQKYRNGTLEAAKVIEELIEIGRQIRQDSENNRPTDLSNDEAAFYDALVENGSARQVMADAQLREIAKVLVAQVRRDVRTDWTERKSVQAKLRIEVKKTLKRYGYPPDQQKIATDMVLEQAKRYGEEWSRIQREYDGHYSGASLVD